MRTYNIHASSHRHLFRKLIELRKPAATSAKTSSARAHVQYIYNAYYIRCSRDDRNHYYTMEVFRDCYARARARAYAMCTVRLTRASGSRLVIYTFPFEWTRRGRLFLLYLNIATVLGMFRCAPAAALTF